MSIAKRFSASVTEKLGFYVYFLIDPETDQIFYVGKGTGNRIFAHLEFALKSPKESDKLGKIREIHQQGLQVRHRIHRHGLTEKEAYEVEASLIDFIGLDVLTNKVSGQQSNDRGQMTVTDVIALYEAPQIEIHEPAILITVNRLFRRGMEAAALYEITRGNWVVGKRREKANFAFAVYDGIVRQVYEIHHWFPVEARSPNQKIRQRWRFEGKVSSAMQHYVGGSVENYITLGNQNPIKYINC
ncbi:MAG: hypothetical protein H6654_00230 [Ardenticatenaceae bacterium]|nr:hypothetical protein [Anaerolineales bacterium]MCB8940627.1 hypothetical protein [Ardenticatenaceae bacterium]MCB8971957.1 hypothetical protein [Ardenticatenaceae bacterium]